MPHRVEARAQLLSGEGGGGVTESQDIINDILQGQPFFEGDPAAVGLGPTAGQPFPASALAPTPTPTATQPGGVTQEDIDRALGGGGGFEGVTQVAQNLFRRADGTFFTLVQGQFGPQQVVVDEARAQSIIAEEGRGRAAPEPTRGPGTFRAPGVFQAEDGSFFADVNLTIPIEPNTAVSIINEFQRGITPQEGLSPESQARETRLGGQFESELDLANRRFAFDQFQSQQAQQRQQQNFLSQLASDPGNFLQLAIASNLVPTVPQSLAPLFPTAQGQAPFVGGEEIPGFADFLRRQQAAQQGQAPPPGAPAAPTAPATDEAAPPTAPATTGFNREDFLPGGRFERTGNEPRGRSIPGLAPEPGTAGFEREEAEGRIPQEFFGGGVVSGESAQTLQREAPPPPPFTAPTQRFPQRQFVSTTGGLNFPGFGTGTFDFSQQGVTRPFGVSEQQFAAEQGGALAPGVTRGEAGQHTQGITSLNPQAQNQAQAPLGFLPELTTPSAQFFANLNPTSRSQFGGLERGRTGASFADTSFRLAQRAPPGGTSRSLTRVR